MQIDRVFYPVKTLGYGNRLGIWTIGCPRRCEGCSNPELQESDETREIQVEQILKIAGSCLDKIDGVTITGGEPFFCPEELEKLVSGLYSLGIRDILVYTGYTLGQLSEMDECKRIIQFIGVLIDGEYVDSLNDNKGIRGSSNQRIHILDKALAERYENADNWRRESSIINSGGRVMAVGIPIRKK